MIWKDNAISQIEFLQSALRDLQSTLQVSPAVHQAIRYMQAAQKSLDVARFLIQEAGEIIERKPR